MNLENDKTSKPSVSVPKLTNKLDFKISAPTCNDKFELPDGYSITDILNYFEYILKNHNESIDNSSIRIYVNKIENRITFEIKKEYYVKLLILLKMKFTGNTENKITKDKDGENVPHLEITEVILVHCNIFNNGYQQDSGALYTFVPNEPFGQLLEVSPTNLIFLKTFNSGFQATELWFTGKNNQPLEIEDRINLTVVIKWYKCVIQLNLENWLENM